MTDIPNFVSQVQEVERKLNAEWLSVEENWRDRIAEDFRERVLEPYMQKFQQYITGEGFNGYGVEQLLSQMDNHLQDMASLVE